LPRVFTLASENRWVEVGDRRKQETAEGMYDRPRRLGEGASALTLDAREILRSPSVPSLRASVNAA